MAHMRRIYLVASLLALSTMLLVACGNAPTAPTTPQLAGVWTGEIMEPSNVNFPDVGLVYLRLDEDGGGHLTGSSKMCHGVFGIHVASPDVAGVVTPNGDVTLDVSPFHFQGTYSPAGISLNGSANGHSSLTLTLAPASVSDFATACPTPSAGTPAG